MSRKPTNPSDQPGLDPKADLLDEEIAGEDEDLGESLPLELDLTSEEASPGAVQKGTAVIRAHLRDAPKGPGVYRMLSQDGEVLYVGKARSLKKRVLQYAQGRFHTQRIALMVDLTRAM